MQGRMVIRPSLYLVAQMLNTEYQILALFFLFNKPASYKLLACS